MEGKKFYQTLYFQVIVGIAIGITLGFFAPHLAKDLKPIGTGFIKLIKMMIAPIIFGTVVVGIAKMGDMKKVGRVGVKALLYFEAVTTLALVIGLAMVHLIAPGKGINVDVSQLDTHGIAQFTSGSKHLSTLDFVMNIIPNSVVDAFARGEILQVLLFSILFGFGLAHMGKQGEKVLHFIDEFTHGMFVAIGYIMKLAPLGAMGAMAFAVASFGGGTLTGLLKLLAGVYLTAFLFVFLVLGTIAKLNGFSLWKFIKYIKEEFFVVMGTSSSETVLPRLMAKLENAGCAQSVVGLTIPTGYTFNLDGTSIYLTMAAVFIAQATNTPLTFGQEMTILGILLLTSKGAAAVAGGGFICLAATLSTVPTLPVAGLALLLGVDWFMATCRALTNMIGNGVATIVVANWENSLDKNRLKCVLDGDYELEAEQPEEVLVMEPAVGCNKTDA
ncbi:dicarboxylate/amino acid:cation symporter [Fundidesulfovibrio terrae]|uniref:dicarboxylate/amino acid:cation symporter n=1 Tax=Fundidesulfovibrio terrae TaxID=2922866 RepID=UPI001FAEB725